jgi:hypothetical protein
MAEQGYIVTNEATGEHAWWDEQTKTLTPVQRVTADAEKAQIGKLNELDKSTQSYKSALESRQPEAPPMKLSDFTKERQRSAIQEPAFQTLKNATIPTAAAAASMIPGVGTLAGAGIQAAGTAVNQVLGNEPYSLGEIAKSAALPLAIPAIVRPLINAGKGTAKAIGKFVNPGATRTAAVEAGVERIGGTPNAINRAYEPRASGAAYDAVRATAEEVPTNLINRAVTNAINELPRANAPKSAVEYLKNLSNTVDAEGSLPYADIHKQINGMYAKAKDLILSNEGEAGQALMNARAKILDELDKVSPALKQANDLYRREQATERISKVLSNPRPDVKLSELLISDPLTRGVIPYRDAKFLESLSKQIATMGTQASPYGGLGARFLNLVSTPIAAAASTPAGMYLLRQTFKDGKVTVSGLAAAAQFGRAYMAQGGEEQKAP